MTQKNKPENILETGEYVEPYSFSNEDEAILFKSYIEHIKFIEIIQKERDSLFEFTKYVLETTPDILTYQKAYFLIKRINK